jgi:hypothetical protein
MSISTYIFCTKYSSLDNSYIADVPNFEVASETLTIDIMDT